ncbi:hypothetical protein ACMYZ5_03420 [Bacteroides sp. KG68]|uniref:hypothetical protein n=1 Tax=unclassified Bacteroides TaxID=2646097 RepID=UPI003D994442
MNATKTKAVLFDFDGVVVDTEAQYSKFWHRIGEEYLGMDDMEGKVKGQTLVYIYDAFFNGRMKEHHQLAEAIAPLCHHILDDFIGFTYDKLTRLHK